MPIERKRPKPEGFNSTANLPFELRIEDFSLAMQDIYDFFFDVNSFLVKKGLQRLDDMLRPAIMSGLLSDLLTSSLAKHSRTLVQNQHFNGHPDLLIKGVYPNDAAKAGVEGVEIKTTRKAGGAVDTHGAREQWMTVFVYAVDGQTEPARDRAPLRFTEVYLGHVTIADFSQERARRTRNTHRDAASRRHPQAAAKLGLSGIRPAGQIGAGLLRARP